MSRVADPFVVLIGKGRPRWRSVYTLIITKAGRYFKFVDFSRVLSFNYVLIKNKTKRRFDLGFDIEIWQWVIHRYKVGCSTMCDSREFCRSSRGSTVGINFDALGDVEHLEHIAGDLLDLYKSKEHTDVTFIVNDVRFPAHKVVLAARCTYFRILFFGEMKEARLGPDGEIPFTDTTSEAFGLLLEYIYSGKLCLGDICEDVSLYFPPLY